MIIIDMKMPKSCEQCKCYVPYYIDYNDKDTGNLSYCQIASQGIPNRYGYDGNVKPEWCPIMGDMDVLQAEIADSKIDFDIDIGEEAIYNNAVDDVLEIIDEYIKGGRE